ncbi:MAG: MotA/TolQ/ExbB proton channel family protein [Sphingomonadales bacterium]|nr:MotA/TolQ/ExbB proton channel family protein [Sphingomonadales bacterium]
MSLLASVDWPTIGLVFGGTLLATVLRCGFAETAVALRMLARVAFGTRFEAGPARAQLAAQIQDIRKDGLIRAHHFQIGDREFDEASKAMIGERSIAALLEAHEKHKARRAVRAHVAARTLAMAAELAPVFGLFGTLVSLGLLPTHGVGRSGYMAAIGMAVHATMVGLLAANLLFAPLARLIERRLAAEEVERQELFDWLALQLAVSEPHLREAHRHDAHAEPRGAQVHRFSAG